MLLLYVKRKQKGRNGHLAFLQGPDLLYLFFKGDFMTFSPLESFQEKNKRPII